MQNDNFASFIDQLKSKCNIVDVISRYVPLDRKGNTYWACCPIHNEKTPSFAVNEYKGTYTCYGCHAHGDAFSFIMQMESCTFMDAVKILADRAGVEVPTFHNDKGDYYKQRKERLYGLMRDTALYYNGNLKSPKAALALEYINKRKLTMQTVTRFGMGVSIGFSELPAYLKERGYTEEEMLESGVCDTKNGKIYDALAERLIVPIINNVGKVIAFGGRMLKDADFAKYKNTKETILFEKRKELFGFTNLKKAKQEGGIKNVIVVEGYMDVISLCQAGINNVCASMGTALTPEQCKALKFYNDNIYLCYDGDSAGQKATYRGIDILRELNFNIRVVTIPGGLDPDDVIKQYGKDKFLEILGEAIPPMEYKLRELASRYDLLEPSEQGKFTSEAINLIKELGSVVEQEAYLPMIRDMSGLTLDTIRHEFNTRNSIADSGDNIQSLVKLESNKRQSAAVDRYYRAARYVLKSLFVGKEDYDYKDDLIAYFDDEEHKQLYNYARGLNSMNEPIYLDRLVEDDISAEAQKIFDSDFNITDDKSGHKMFLDNIKALKIGYLQVKVEELTLQAECEESMQAKKELLMKIQDLNKGIRELK